MTALSPISWLAVAHRRAYESGLLRSREVGAPVVSVGALAMGGSGKTPVARAVAERLRDRGLAVGVVCGGYGGAARGPGVVDPDDPTSVRRFGDEAALLAGWLGPLPVVAGRDKLAAARLAVSRGARVVVVDDGFQHQRLARDLDLVVYHHDPAPAVVPFGPGREPASALGRADLLWLHLRDGARGMTPRAGPHAIDVVSRLRPAGLLRAGGDRLPLRRLEGARVCLLAGIAVPGAFRRLVETLGARVVGQVFVRDHHRFSRRDLRRAAATRPDLMLCTEKDLARMRWCEEAAVLTALVCRTEILRGAGRLDRALAGLQVGQG